MKFDGWQRQQSDDDRSMVSWWNDARGLRLTRHWKWIQVAGLRKWELWTDAGHGMRLHADSLRGLIALWVEERLEGRWP